MPGEQDVPGVHHRTCAVEGQATAGTVDSFPIFVADAPGTVVSVTWIPSAAVDGDDTNNFALQVLNKGHVDGSGAVAVTAVKTYDNAHNSVAYEAEVLTVSATAANLVLRTGDVLALVRTKTGTGLAMPKGIVDVGFEYGTAGL